MWTTEDVLTYLTEIGKPIARDTWSSDVSRKQAPEPARRIGRTPVWKPSAVREWAANRPGEGYRTDLH